MQMAETVDGLNATASKQRPGVPIGAWWMLFVLFGLYAFSFIDRQVITMMVPQIKESLQLTDFEMSLILGPAFVVVYSIFSLPLGWAADRYSRRWVIFLGAVGFGLATSASALADSFAMMVAARMFIGIGEASLTPAAFSLIADRFPRRLFATANAVYATASKVGTASAYAIGGVLLGVLSPGLLSGHFGIGEIEPWRMVFLIVGAPAIFASFLVFTFAEPKRTVVKLNEQGRMTPNITEFLRNKRVLLICMLLGFSLVSVCSLALVAWAPTYIARRFEWEPIQYGPVLGLISMIAALTLVFKGALADWLYARGGKEAHVRFYSWLLISTMPFAAVMFFVDDAVIFMICYGIVQVVAMPTIVFLSTTLQLIVPGHLRGQITAVAIVCLNVIGGSVGPVSVGALTDYLFRDDQMVGYSLAIVLGIAMPAAFVLLRIALKPLRVAIIESER